MWFKKLFEKNKKTVEYNYENELFEKYKECKNSHFGIKILVFSDTHNNLDLTEDLINKIHKFDYDVCLLLGDHSYNDIQSILQFVPLEKIYGIRGNHDKLDDLKYCGIPNIHGKVITIKSVKIGALQGSIKYKETTAPLYTQEESLLESSRLEDIDVLISHDTYFSKDSEEPVHDGLKGITEAIYRNNVSIHIHGHLHIEDERLLLNGCRSIGVYGIKFIEI